MWPSGQSGGLAGSNLGSFSVAAAISICYGFRVMVWSLASSSFWLHMKLLLHFDDAGAAAAAE